MTTDPHKCAFGKWYDTYKAENSSVLFNSTFAKFDKPHKVIHQIGIDVQTLIKQNQKQKAIDVINLVKDTELKQMMHLFDDLKSAYKESRREIVVVIGQDERNCLGLSVDQINSIENLSDIDETLIKETVTSTEYLSGTGKRKDGSVAFILNDEYILDAHHRKSI